MEAYAMQRDACSARRMARRLGGTENVGFASPLPQIGVFWGEQ